jgi:TolB-like protein
VREQIRDRLALPFADGGEHSVKNIARPIRVYALSADAVAALPKAAAPAAPRPVAPRDPRQVIAAVALAGSLIIAGGMWWLWPSPKPPSGTATGPVLEKAAAVASPRMSIVVLPFGNLSNDPEQQFFVDGVTEDLTTDLSRIATSFVISRNTAFTYKDKPVDAKQIGRELGVRYVLEGSVQRTGKQVRVNAQLIDAEIDAHVWAERFERDIGDLFALQNDITSRIAIAPNLALIDAEAARPTVNPDALDYILRGRAAWLRPFSRDNNAEQIGFFEHALALDAHSVEAQAWLANALASRVLGGVSDSAAADIARAEGLRASLGRIAPQLALAFRQSPDIARGAPICGGHSRIRGGARVQSQLGVSITRSQPVQALHRVDRGDDPARRASHPPQSPRLQYLRFLSPDRAGAPAAIAHRRGDHLARKGA